MSDIGHIVLDLDGPLLDGKERHYYCYQNILEQFEFLPIGIDEYWEKKRAALPRRDLLNMSGAGKIYDDFLAAWLIMIESPDMLALDKVQEGAVDRLRRWKQKGIKLTLVTMRKNKQALAKQLVAMGLRHLLDSVVVCDHAGGGAGKADAVRHIFEDRAKQRRALWIGDTEVDWEAARVLGCRTVLLSNGLRNEAYLRALKGAVVESSIASLEDNVLGRLNVS